MNADDQRINELATQYSTADCPKLRQELKTEICELGSDYVRRVVMRAAGGNRDYRLTAGDLVQVGWRALCEQLEKYDPSRNDSFTSFAYTRIFYSAIDANRAMSGWKQAAARKGEEQVQVLSGDATVRASSDSQTSRFESLELVDGSDEFLAVENDERVIPAIRSTLQAATLNQSLALTLGLEGVDRHTIANLLGITPSAVQSASAAMRKRLRRTLAGLEATA